MLAGNLVKLDLSVVHKNIDQLLMTDTFNLIEFRVMNHQSAKPNHPNVLRRYASMQKWINQHEKGKNN